MPDVSTRWLPYNSAQCVGISKISPYDSLPITITEQQVGVIARVTGKHASYVRLEIKKYANLCMSLLVCSCNITQMFIKILAVVNALENHNALAVLLPMHNYQVVN